MYGDCEQIDGSFDQQPVHIGIKTDKSSYQMYMSDHGKHVSYDTDSGNEYWKVKNSWSTTWCANTMARRAVSAHHVGVLYSDTNLMQSHMYIQRTNQDV